MRRGAADPPRRRMRGPGTRRCVSISAGAHGDEPAAPAALYALVRDRLLDPAFSYRLWPCFNPTGFGAGTRTNVDGADVNRKLRARRDDPSKSRAVLTANRDLPSSPSRSTCTKTLRPPGSTSTTSSAPARTSRFARPVADAVAEAGFPLQTRLGGVRGRPAGLGGRPRACIGRRGNRRRAVAETPAFAGSAPAGARPLAPRGRAARVATFESPARAGRGTIGSRSTGSRWWPRWRSCVPAR